MTRTDAFLKWLVYACLHRLINRADRRGDETALNGYVDVAARMLATEDARSSR